MPDDLNTTQYNVMQRGCKVASGNLRQCWLYILNTHADNTTAAALSEMGVYITPAGKE